jgi:hypothetical protein
MALTDFEIVDIDTYTVGLDRARLMLHELEAALADMHGVLEDIIGDFHRQTLAQFASDGGVLGEPWEPLEPGTVAEKAASGSLFPEWPLVDTGKMMASATGDGPYSVTDIADQAAALSLDWERDGYNIPLLHQLGVPERLVHRRAYVTRTGKRIRATSYMWHLPSRPFWGFTEALADEGIDRIADHLWGPLLT